MIPIDAFMQVLGKHYIALRQNLKSYCYSNNLEFSEDVFHSTLVSCYNTVNKNNIVFATEDEVKYYFCKAFKINLLRNKGYSDNKPKEDYINFDSSISEEQINNCDFSIINNKIIKKFGNQLYDIFIENVEGTSIADLQEKYKIKNLKQKIKSVKIYIQCEFNE